MEAVKQPQSLATQPKTPPSAEEAVKKLSTLLIHVHYGIELREDQEATVIEASKVFHAQNGSGPEAETIRTRLKTKSWKQFLFLKHHPDTLLVLKNTEENRSKTCVIEINELLVSLISDVFHRLIDVNRFSGKREKFNPAGQIDTMITVPASRNLIEGYFFLVHFLQGNIAPHTIKQCREIVDFAESLLIDSNVAKMGWQENELLKILGENPSVKKTFKVLVWALQFNMPQVRTTCRCMLTRYCTQNITELGKIIGEFKDLAATLDGMENSSFSFSSLKPVITAELNQAISSATSGALQHFLESSKKCVQFKQIANAICEIIKNNPDIFQSVIVDCNFPLNITDPKSYALRLLKTTTSLRFINVGHTSTIDLNKIAQRLPNLQTLTVEDAQWENFLFSGELSISTLGIRNCPNLETLDCLVYAPKLTVIELQNAPKFTASLLPNTIKILVQNNFD